MKEKMILGMSFLFLVALAGAPALYAVDEVAAEMSNVLGDAGDKAVSGQADDAGATEMSNPADDAGTKDASNPADEAGAKEVSNPAGDAGAKEVPDEIDVEGAKDVSSPGDDAGTNKEVYSQVDDETSDPSDFEGDSDDMPGERAPESMPMDDAPVEGGVDL